MGVDARIANLPHPIKMQGAGPSFVEDEELSLPRATTPKVVAKFKPPVRVEPPKPAGSSVSAEAQSMKPIPAASFYGASRKQQAQYVPNTDLKVRSNVTPVADHTEGMTRKRRTRSL